MSENLIYGFGGLLFFQAYVTVRVVRHKPYTPAQKRRQLLFVWLVPFIGAAIAIASLATDENPPGRPD
jgi:tellurite resistance protein TehA-like permease